MHNNESSKCAALFGMLSKFTEAENETCLNMNSS